MPEWTLITAVCAVIALAAFFALVALGVNPWLAAFTAAAVGALVSRS